MNEQTQNFYFSTANLSATKETIIGLNRLVYYLSNRGFHVSLATEDRHVLTVTHNADAEGFMLVFAEVQGIVEGWSEAARLPFLSNRMPGLPARP